MWVAIWAGAALSSDALLLVVLLAVPGDLRFKLVREPGAASRVRVLWLFGLVGKDLTGDKHEQPAKKRERSLASLARFPRLVNARFGEKAARLILGLLRAVHVRDLRVRIRIGLGDPMYTGMAYGLTAPCVSLLRSTGQSEISVEPAWDDATLQGEISGWVRVYPIAMAPPLVTFVLSPTVIRTLIAIKRGR